MEASLSSRMISLNGTNYHLWREKMKNLLYVKSWHLPVFSSQKPESKIDEEWEFAHSQVCGFIRQWVDDNVYNHICDETHARSLWEKLEFLYARKTGKNKLFLLKKMANIHLKEDRTITDYLSDFQQILQQLSSMGVKFDDEIQALWLLNSLPDSWETFRISLTSSAPNGVVTLEQVKSAVLNEEMRRKSQNSSSSSRSDLLVADLRGRSQSREQNPRGKYANVECHHCKKKGHIKKFCRKFKKENKAKKDDDSDDEQTNVIDSSELL